MESNGQNNYSEDRLTRIIRMTEMLIRRCVSAKFKVSNPEYYHISFQVGLTKFQQLCYPIGLGDERIADYILYQIYRTRDSVGKGRWSLTWLFTPASITKYYQQFIDKNGKSGIRYYMNEWLADCGLDISDLTRMIQPPKPNPMRKFIYMPSEEPIKKRWYNTDMGYMLCQKATTGWSPQSEACRNCNYTTRCIEFIKHNYPELLRLRKELQNG